jgi:hypothetical protein
MPSKKSNHTHKLKRHSYKSGNAVYFCVDDCNFKIDVALALGKSSICWRCGSTFKLNTYSSKLAKPHCEDCHSYSSKLKDPAIATSTNSINTSNINSVSTSLAMIGADRIESLKDRMNGIRQGIKYVNIPSDDDDEDLL